MNRHRRLARLMWGRCRYRLMIHRRCGVPEDRLQSLSPLQTRGHWRASRSRHRTQWAEVAAPTTLRASDKFSYRIPPRAATGAPIWKPCARWILQQAASQRTRPRNRVFCSRWPAYGGADSQIGASRPLSPRNSSAILGKCGFNSHPGDRPYWLRCTTLKRRGEVHLAR